MSIDVLFKLALKVKTELEICFTSFILTVRYLRRKSSSYQTLWNLADFCDTVYFIDCEEYPQVVRAEMKTNWFAQPDFMKINAC